MALELKDFPPAPTAEQPVTVSLELSPEWLEFHNLEIVGWDEKRGGCLVRKRKTKLILSSTTTEAL